MASDGRRRQDAVVPRLRYLLLDVFTDRPFAGNQLAVFVDPLDVGGEVMQALAAELNLAETVFVWPPAASGEPWPTRIFTPSVELPFAGHPTIGTAVALAELGHVDERVVLAEGVGDVTVVLGGGPGSRTARLTAAELPRLVDQPRPDVVARVLGLDVADLDPAHPPGAWSAGLPFCVTPLRDLDALARVRVDRGAWEAELVGTAAEQLYPLAPAGPAGDEWQVRMFAPGLGLPEDPATGAAAAAVARFLHDATGRTTWRLHQGAAIGRPSRLDVSVDVVDGQLVAVHVGGSAVVVGEGELEAGLPPR